MTFKRKTLRTLGRAVVAIVVLVLIGLLASRFNEVGRLLLPPNYARNATESSPIFNGTDAGDCTCSFSPENSLHRSTAAQLGLQGEVSDCCCSFDTIEKTNEELYPLLRRIVATPFFSHFKIDLCSECQLWKDSPMCVLRDCSVCECESPPIWASEVDWMPDELECQHIEDEVVTSVDAHVTDTFGSLVQTDTFFGEDTTAEEDEDTAVVVDLRKNPEQYTGYTGRSAEKVWKAVHEENCFQQEDESDGTCGLSADQRVYNRVISGMHSSISLHVASSYCLELDTDRIAECKTWGANRTLAYERVLSRKDRLENLYVVFAVMLRAVQKASAAIAAAVPEQDSYFAESLIEWKEHLQPELLKITRSCPLTFDESELFNAYAQEDAEYKRKELKRRISHLFEVMECVGCDRCKLWGTLQSLGVGTALRIIIDDDDLQVTNLSRQEAVALVHTLERFSSALVYADQLR